MYRLLILLIVVFVMCWITKLVLSCWFGLGYLSSVILAVDKVIKTALSKDKDQ